VTPEESTAILKLATAVGTMTARLDAMEEARREGRALIQKRLDDMDDCRKEARADDHAWRESVGSDIDQIKGCITEMPCLMDAKIRACREQREVITHDAVENAMRHHVLEDVATDWRTWLAFAFGVAGILYGILK
jgi:hypothetical protein